MSSKLDQNRFYAARMGWQPLEFGAPVNDFTSGLVSAIEDVQRTVGVTVDGVAGPKTYTALLAYRRDGLAKSYPVSTADKTSWLENAGMIAMLSLKVAWVEDGGVIDLPAKGAANYHHCQSFIDRAIRTAAGLGWAWEDPYEANVNGAGNFEWCGAAAAFGWRKANLKLSTAKDYFSANYRLDRFASYKQAFDHLPNPRPTSGTLRKWAAFDESSKAVDVEPFGARAGDIALFGPAKSAYGKHVTMIEYVDLERGVIHTIEGNGNGLGPDGVYRQGVVRAVRPIGLGPGIKPTTYHLRRLIRVAPSDLI